MEDAPRGRGGGGGVEGQEGGVGKASAAKGEGRGDQGASTDVQKGFGFSLKKSGKALL